MECANVYIEAILLFLYGISLYFYGRGIKLSETKTLGRLSRCALNGLAFAIIILASTASGMLLVIGCY